MENGNEGGGSDKRNDGGRKKRKEGEGGRKMRDVQVVGEGRERGRRQGAEC